jgi:hypothetical protein
MEFSMPQIVSGRGAWAASKYDPPFRSAVDVMRKFRREKSVAGLRFAS